MSTHNFRAAKNQETPGLVVVPGAGGVAWQPGTWFPDSKPHGSLWGLASPLTAGCPVPPTSLRFRVGTGERVTDPQAISGTPLPQLPHLCPTNEAVWFGRKTRRLGGKRKGRYHGTGAPSLAQPLPPRADSLKKPGTSLGKWFGTRG